MFMFFFFYSIKGNSTDVTGVELYCHMCVSNTKLSFSWPPGHLCVGGASRGSVVDVMWTNEIS